jgi:hypothetical protein
MRRVDVGADARIFPVREALISGTRAIQDTPDRRRLDAAVGRETLVGLHRDLQLPTDRVDVSTLSLQPIGLAQLPHDLLRRVPLPLHESHLRALTGRS